MTGGLEAEPRVPTRNREDLRLLLSDFPLVDPERDTLEGLDAAFSVTFHAPERPARVRRFVMGDWSTVLTVDADRDEAQAAHSWYADGESTSHAPGHEESNGCIEAMSLDMFIERTVLGAQTWTHVLLRDARELRRRKQVAAREEKRRRRVRWAVDAGLVLLLGALIWKVWG